MNRRGFLGYLLKFGAAAIALPPVAALVRALPVKALPVPQSELALLVEATLRDLGKPKFHEIATTMQRHAALKNLLRHKGSISFDVKVDV